MRRIIAVLSVMALMLAMSVAPAFATQPLEPNPGSPLQPSNNNCIATGSSALTHNGSAVRNQDRQAAIQGLQATCNNANQK